MRTTPVFFSLALAILLISFETTRADSLAMIEEKVDALSAEIAQIKKTATDSNDKPVDVAFSGMVNMGVLALNDGRRGGDDKQFFIVDNNNYSTHLRADATKRYDNDISGGVTFEVQLKINSTADIAQDSPGLAGSDNFTRRIVEFFFTSKKYGTLFLGHGSTASDFSSERDLSETWLAASASVDSIAAGLKLRKKDDHTLTEIKISDVFTDLDGLGRTMRVRYDTPTFLHCSLSGSILDGGDWDTALRYDNTMRAVTTAATIAYAHARQINNFQQVSTSLAARHNPSGINIALAAATKQLTGPTENTNRSNPHYYYAKLGVLKTWFSCGKTAMSVDYYNGFNIRENNDRSSTYSGAITQAVEKLNTHFYLTGRQYTYKDPSSTEYISLWAVLIGGNVMF